VKEYYKNRSIFRNIRTRQIKCVDIRMVYGELLYREIGILENDNVCLARGGHSKACKSGDLQAY
jgi:hypothetical protein